MQKVLNRGNYKLDAIIDKLLVQIKFPKNFILGEYYVLLNRLRLTTFQIQSINQKMQRQLKNATVKSLCVSFFDNKNVFISK